MQSSTVPRKPYLGECPTGEKVIRTVFTWRLPPEESLSDWKIQIRPLPRTNAGEKAASTGNTDENVPVEAIYHIHTYVLGIGPRRSSYFVHLFHRAHGMMLENKTKTSTIALEETAADVFPNMLDFMYDPSKDVVVKNAIQATALRHLASYFGIKELFDNVNETFIQNDILNIDTVFDYMEAASSTYQDEALLHAAIDSLATKMRSKKCNHVLSAKILAMPLDWFSRLASNAADFYPIGALLADYIDNAKNQQQQQELTRDYVSTVMKRLMDHRIPSLQGVRLFQIAAEFDLDDALKKRLAIAFERHWEVLADGLQGGSGQHPVVVAYNTLSESEKLRVLQITFCQTARKLSEADTTHF